MRELNGFTIIAHKPSSLGQLVILGVREYSSGAFEYVTAGMRSLDDSEWDSGHYFFHDIIRAIKDYNER